MNKADQHLINADAVLKALIENGGVIGRSDKRRPDDYYGALVRSIAGQQLSVKAADAIWNRLIGRFDGRIPQPNDILAQDPQELRTAVGFSNAKVAYLRSLAEHVVSGELDLVAISTLPDEEVIAELTAVKGIGEWTAHMFLMFTLGRPDILPTGDLGLRNAITALYVLESVPKVEEMISLAEPWRPYRTRASLYLWRSLDNEPKV